MLVQVVRKHNIVFRGLDNISKYLMLGITKSLCITRLLNDSVEFAVTQHSFYANTPVA
jgi:hypothetical protein